MIAQGIKTIPAAACAALMIALLCLRPAWADPTERQAAIRQVAAFTEQDRALALINSLSQEGKIAILLEKSVDGVTYYTVLVDSMPLGIKAPEPRMENTPVELPSPKAGIANSPEPATSYKNINEGPFEEVTLAPLYPDSKETIALMSNTPVYMAPVEGAPFIGTYRSLGGGQYAGVHDGWHSLWLPIENYGYVRGPDARTVPHTPSAEPAAQ